MAIYLLRIPSNYLNRSQNTFLLAFGYDRIRETKCSKNVDEHVQIQEAHTARVTAHIAYDDNVDNYMLGNRQFSCEGYNNERKSLMYSLDYTTVLFATLEVYQHVFEMMWNHWQIIRHS